MMTVDDGKVWIKKLSLEEQIIQRWRMAISTMLLTEYAALTEYQLR